MNRFILGQIADWAGGRLLAGDPASPVTGFTWDSRLVAPGMCFVALPGARADGHDFVSAALAAGAAGALVSRADAAPPGSPCILVPDTLLALGTAAACHRRQFHLPVVGVTGSVGKTTTKEMVAAVLSTRYRTFRTTGNFNSEVGLPTLLLNELNGAHQAAVVEMGMRGLGEIAYLVSIARPTLAVVTNVGVSHLELLGSRENIARAKAELVAGLPPGGTAVLNADDERVAAMQALAPGPVVLYSLEGAHGPQFVTLQHLRREGEVGQAFTLVTWQGSVEVYLPAPGRHNALNALAAAGVGLALGLTLDEIAAGLSNFTPVGSRMNIMEIHGVRILDDSYNAAPASVQAALAVLADLGRGGRRVAVLGDMAELGEAAAAGHREVGAAAAACADLLVAVGREDRAGLMAAGARGAGMAAVHRFAEKPAAIAFLLRELRPGDTVLVKGSLSMGMKEIVTALQNHLPRLP